MEALFGTLGILGFTVGIILLIISLIKKSSKKRPLFIVITSIVLFGIAMANSTTPESTKDKETVAQPTKETQKDIKDETKEETTKTEPVKEKESVPIEYKNALIKGQQYAERMYMSERGVYDQLVSEYGENFPEEAAQYAIENIKADYNKNALEKAKTYQSRMSMSRDSIWEQLVSEHGENFTEEQANYALENLPN
ncbi:Ltp family lipoprotein [Erysipelothrix rhusiopathiae]|uniref:Ltp family lipoprotein n=1 Tax=Erysipelothrix rhusiopathiae TaxID=1648 RepID=UPI0024810077|nr:Ltp family lipoprotein [Erysipelothrix rhusiopathiae]